MSEKIVYKELDTKELSGKLNDARLWILGPGVGESIVILTSHGKCIVIDCVKYEDSNFTIDILRENGVKKIDILVNNAGIWEYGEADKMSLREWNKTMQANLTSMFLITNK